MCFLELYLHESYLANVTDELVFTSQINYFSLVWMCHNGTINNKIDLLHEKCLPIVYNGNKSSFQELLDKNNDVTIYVKNVPALAVEMFNPLMHNVPKWSDTL